MLSSSWWSEGPEGSGVEEGASGVRTVSGQGNLARDLRESSLWHHVGLQAAYINAAGKQLVSSAWLRGPQAWTKGQDVHGDSLQPDCK